MALLSFAPLLFANPAGATEIVEPEIIVITTPGGDDSSYEIPLTTTVVFDGVTYSSVYATTNSVITFGTPDGTYWDFPQTPSISLYSMDWVVYPQWRSDEHLIIRSSDGGFQVEISARPIWLQSAPEPTSINILAAINSDGTVAISYSMTGPDYSDYPWIRTGVRLHSGAVVTLDQYGITQVVEPPVLQPVPIEPTPEVTEDVVRTEDVARTEEVSRTEEVVREPEPTPPAPQPAPEPIITPEPQPEPEPTPERPVSPVEPTIPVDEESLPEQPVEPPTSPTEPEISPEPAPEVESEPIGVMVAVEAIGEAVAKAIDAFATAGLDMSPEKREEAQQLVVSSIIVTQVASAASVAVRKIK